MQNQAMKRKLDNHEAIDVSLCDRTPEGYYVLPAELVPTEGSELDYCDAKTEQWIWSIGRFVDGRIMASTSPELYGHPNVEECLFLR